ncbi:Fe-S cluster assembly protein SufD [Paraflavisolibacter sp. H34]|uniref:Fe-S cluster assembly protein SufD n=1 Tax=Huijunlia imazamoxiresistens TaxID=3127457 RepID=UPI0030166B65
MANQVSIPLYEELVGSFEEVLATAEQSTAVQQARRQGIENFKKMGFPSRRNEEWKYTNLLPFLQEGYSTDGRTSVAADAELIAEAQVPHLDSYQLVFVNGELQPATEAVPAFIRVMPFEDALTDEQFAAHFSKNTDIDQFPMAALNTALFSHGLFIEISPNAVLDKPLHIVHTYTATANLFVQPRLLVVARRGANLSIIETIVSKSTDNKLFINSLTEVFVEENAICDHYVLQTAKAGTRLVTNTEVSQLRDSVYSNYTFSLPGAELIRNNLHLSLDESNTESHLYGLYLGADNQLIDNHSLVNHRMPHCQSNEIYKGVLLDNATGVFNGKIFVQEDAQKTNAFQQNNNLLLSDKATINSKPQLEIFADDVKCSHGSTVGQLSKEAMFYLQSRGIGEQKARALLVNAFAFDVTEKIKLEELEDHINHLIQSHIPLSESVIDETVIDETVIDAE